MAVFLIGMVCIVLGFELMRSGMATEGPLQTAWLEGTAPIGFLLLFVGIVLSLIGFGYLATPLEPWRTAPDEWGDLRTFPARPGVDAGVVARRARVAWILIVAGLLLLEALPMYTMVTETKLFTRDNCTRNCSALTGSEIAFLLDLIPIAIADAFVVVMLFVFIQPCRRSVMTCSANASPGSSAPKPYTARALGRPTHGVSVSRRGLRGRPPGHGPERRTDIDPVRLRPPP